jgi:hypothetical protein
MSEIDRIRQTGRVKMARDWVFVVLTVELFLAQLAIASPQLHNWMHGETVCSHHESTNANSDDSSDCKDGEDHICSIHLLNEGIASFTDGETTSIACEAVSLPDQTFWFAADSAVARHSARGPPVTFR